jgi:hypothetical protein
MVSMELMPIETRESQARENARPTIGGTMPDIDVDWLIRELGELGLKLTATPRLDGSFGLNKWRTISYWDNAAQAEALWAEHVHDDPEVIAAIAAHVGAPLLVRRNLPPTASSSPHG